MTNGAKYTVPFSSEDGKFTGKIVLLIEKKDTPATDHQITITQVEGATITTDPADKATAGSPVKVTVNVTDSSKVLDKIQVNGVDITGNSFTMPRKDTTVTAVLKDKGQSQTHSITVDTITGATLATKPEHRAAAGTQVIAFINVLDATKELDRFVITDSENQPISINANNYITIPKKRRNYQRCIKGQETPPSRRSQNFGLSRNSVHLSKQSRPLSKDWSEPFQDLSKQQFLLKNPRCVRNYEV